jgi:hypothetical protein
MAKVIYLGWVQEDDPRYQEGWTVSATLGLHERATRDAGGSEGEGSAGKGAALGGEALQPRKGKKRAKSPRRK